MRSVLFIFASVMFFAASLSPVAAMNRWDALSMLESGNNDNVIGRYGEISRFQICPRFWPGGNPRDSKFALEVAQKIMSARMDEFRALYNRAPTDFEFYVLWNAPLQLNHPSKVVAERAQRFVNLVQRPDFASR